MNNKRNNLQNKNSPNHQNEKASNCKHGHHCDKGDHNTRSMH